MPTLSRDGTPFFVMEYVEGVPLTQYCQQRRSSLDDASAPDPCRSAKRFSTRTSMASFIAI